MLLILEVLLTISAWRKGWGPKALLPLGVGIAFGVIGAVITNSIVPGIVADLLFVAVLIAMLAAKSKKNPAAQVASTPAAEISQQHAA